MTRQAEQRPLERPNSHMYTHEFVCNSTYVCGYVYIKSHKPIECRQCAIIPLNDCACGHGLQKQLSCSCCNYCMNICSLACICMTSTALILHDCIGALCSSHPTDCMTGPSGCAWRHFEHHCFRRAGSIHLYFGSLHAWQGASGYRVVMNITW